MNFASGSPYAMRRALERRVETALVVAEPWPRWFLATNRALRDLSAGRRDAEWSPRLTALAGARTVARVRAARPDVVFALKASPMAHLLVDEFRVVHVSDTTLHAMFGYYAGFDQFSARTRRGGEIIEAKVLRGAFLSVFPSDWARQSAIRDYGVSPDRALEIAFGANLDPVEVRPRTVPAGEWHFLFNGIEWGRKGGQVALDTIAELTRRGVKCRLDIVGCTANVMAGPVPGNVTFHGFVSKTMPDGVALLHRLYSDATALLLPTRADCFGLALSEAMHYGLPVLSTATGGVTSLIKNGVTGILLPPGARGAAFADEAAALLASPARYEAMSRAALADAAARLNWDVWAKRVVEAVSERLRTDR